MRHLLIILFFFFAVSVFAQTTASTKHKQVDQSGTILTGNTVKPVQTEKKSIAIVPALQSDIKQLDEAMKPYEEAWKEYNRLAGLKGHIYEVLAKANGIDVSKVVGQPQVTVDSIKLVLNK